MFFAVVMTGNHFILDTVAGAVVSFAGLGISLAVARYLGWPKLSAPEASPNMFEVPPG